jgi:alkylhydroperoxidase family enzyme
MFLREVEQAIPSGARGADVRAAMAAGAPVPQILHLFAFKPDRTKFLMEFTHGVMRGPSPLPPGLRELIAAFTSSLNRCPF